MSRGMRRAALAAVGAVALLAPASASAATDLAVTKTDSPDPVQAGQLLTYTITVTNAGPDQATDVVLTDELDSAVQFVSASPGCDLQGKTVTCNLGNVDASPAPGETVTITVRPKNAGQITNTATVTTADDTNGANNTATTTTTVTEAGGGGGGGGGGGAGAACGGFAASIVGTRGNDVLVGTPRRDVIAARGGNDVVRGLDRRDIVCGGGGRDTLKGNAGNDKLKGGRGRDTLRGGRGSDKLSGGGGNDRCFGGRGDDVEKSC
ncbi:MAG TPA: hypothetical protein VHF58_10805 [Solirubrobacterales bacterium]|nr:hypothetical protein [Solirubrobacterales bacterium]